MFPSPCGDYGSSDLDLPLDADVFVVCFRPLAGITGLRTDAAAVLLWHLFLVSVPLRGLRVFGQGCLAGPPDRYLQFPSPCGDYGSSDWQRVRQAIVSEYRFPSPCGDYGSSDLGRWQLR